MENFVHASGVSVQLENGNYHSLLQVILDDILKDYASTTPEEDRCVVEVWHPDGQGRGSLVVWISSGGKYLICKRWGDVIRDHAERHSYPFVAELLLRTFIRENPRPFLLELMAPVWFHPDRIAEWLAEDPTRDPLDFQSA